MKRLLGLAVSFVMLMGVLSGCGGETVETVETVQTVTEKEITLTMPTGERSGTYTGEVINDIPNGKGKFEAVNAEGKKWYYEGEFVNGVFEGEGVTVWENGYVNRGVYENSVWKPNSAQVLEAMKTSKWFTMTASAEQFAQEHEELLPAENKQDMDGYINEDISYKMITKEPDKYGGEIIKLNNININQIQTQRFSEELPEVMYTYMTAYDNDLNIFQFYLLGELPEVYDGDTVSEIYGIPLGVGGYETVVGGFANTVDIAVCYIQK